MKIQYYLIYFLIINIISYVLFYVDKQKAIHHQYRISEKILVNTILIGGFIGAYFSMNKYHHKTRKIKFKAALVSGVVIFGLFIYTMISGVNL